MIRLAFVFPGQGSQAVGMGSALAQTSPAAAAVFAEADAAFGEPLSRLAWSGPAEELDLTVNAQPALLAASIAFLRAIEERRAASGRPPLAPVFAAGHSMGQYSALVAAGVVSLGDGMRLVRERGRLMQASGEGSSGDPGGATGDGHTPGRIRESSPGAMAAIIGLPDERLPDLVAVGSAHGTFGIANRNSPGQVVVSGVRPAVEAAAAAAKGLGAKRALVLPVSVAAHSPLMASAAAGLRAVLAGVAFHDPSIPLLANADARPLTTGDDCRAELVDHLTTGVDWIAAVEAMRAAGVTRFVEVGPGRVLCGLIRRIAPDAETIPLDDPGAPGGLADPDPDPDPAAAGPAAAG
jgi:[acyl-carrier-protein] S-malonyltransferase